MQLTLPSGFGPVSAAVLNDFKRNHPHVRFIRFQWQDYSGILRGRVMLIDTVIAHIAKGEPLKATGLAICCSITNNLAPFTPLDGQYWLAPDWSTLHPTVDTRSGQVMCALDYTLPGITASKAFCPRYVLEDVLQQAREGWGLDFLVGFEVEFVVMKCNQSDGTIDRCSDGWGLFAISGLRDPVYQHVEECAMKLEDIGVDIQAIHTEGQRGQYEFALGPKTPVEAVNQLVLVHSYLKGVFTQNGYIVTMMPKPIRSESLATGQHTHLSLNPPRPDLEENFLAGILKRLPALCAFCLSQDVSYERLLPFVGGCNTVCWGTEARKSPIRKIEPSRWEIRNIDAMSNMYLTMASIIGAGLCGLTGKEPLLWPDIMDPANVDASFGDPLPGNVEEAISILEKDEFGLADVLGSPVLERYVMIKRFELSKLKEMDPETIRRLFVELF